MHSPSWYIASQKPSDRSLNTDRPIRHSKYRLTRQCHLKTSNSLHNRGILSAYTLLPISGSPQAELRKINEALALSSYLAAPILLWRDPRGTPRIFANRKPRLV